MTVQKLSSADNGLHNTLWPVPSAEGTVVSPDRRSRTRQMTQIKRRLSFGLKETATQALPCRLPGAVRHGRHASEAPTANMLRGLAARQAVPYLPQELVALVFNMLPAETLGRAACVCRSWRQWADEPSLWRRHLEALEVPEWPEQATDCREAYIAWTACTRYPPVREVNSSSTNQMVTSQLGRVIAAYRDEDNFVIVNPAGHHLATVNHDSCWSAWKVVDDQLVTASESGVVHTWEPDGSLYSIVGKPLPSLLREFAADHHQIATISMSNSVLCVTERTHGSQVYCVELMATANQVRFLDQETLGLFLILPPRLQIWRRDRPEIVRTLDVDPSFWCTLPSPTISSTRMVNLDAPRGNADSHILRTKLAGPDAGRLERLRGPDKLNYYHCLVGETLLCQRSRNHLAVINARTGKLEQEHDLGGLPEDFCCVQSVYRDRISICRSGPIEHIEIWRFTPPSPTELIGRATSRGAKITR
jgi:hypothetical protein